MFDEYKVKTPRSPLSIMRPVFKLDHGELEPKNTGKIKPSVQKRADKESIQARLAASSTEHVKHGQNFTITGASDLFSDESNQK
jgi:hypothetical protein